ncbi:MAG: hypothetical protein FJ395_06235 [Verrucomicrobia bacterium]|nr:hypothetical protein [Verrucomicrobiota bacterium]
MKKCIICCAISLAAAVAFAKPAASLLKANNVNLRARPGLTAELITQVNKGDEVNVLETKPVVEGGKTQQWSRITLPASAKCYVLSKLIADGKAAGDAVNIRSGPGTNFKDVGKLAKGEKVSVVKVAGEWTQIKPTPKCSGWVASEYLEAAPLAAPVIVPALTPAPPVAPKVNEVVSAPVAAPVAEPPAAVAPTEPILTPAPVFPQTPTAPTEPETLQYYVVRDGIFQSVESGVKRSGTPGAPYELMTLMFERRQYRIAYLEMSLSELDKFEGKHVRVLGNLRWRRGERYPIIAVERIEPVW